jgi:hypothetical protein
MRWTYDVVDIDIAVGGSCHSEAGERQAEESRELHGEGEADGGVGPGVVTLSVSVVDFGRSRGRVGREEGVEGVEGVCLFTSETSG